MLYYVLKKYLAAPHRTWDLSSPTKDQTRVPWKQGVLTTVLPGKTPRTNIVCHYLYEVPRVVKFTDRRWKYGCQGLGLGQCVVV